MASRPPLSRLAFLPLLLLLTGCGAVRWTGEKAAGEVNGLNGVTHALGSPFSAGQTFLILDGVSVINTGKTIDDHLVSWISGQDCSTIRAMKGEDYCRPNPTKPVTITRISYCYHDLAGTTCYTQPLPGNTPPTGIEVYQVPVAALPGSP